MKIYLVTPTAVYDHGTGGAFSRLEAARSHAEALLADSDGHHDIRIDEVELDCGVRPICLGNPSCRRRDGRIEVTDGQP